MFSHPSAQKFKRRKKGHGLGPPTSQFPGLIRMKKIRLCALLITLFGILTLALAYMELIFSKSYINVFKHVICYSSIFFSRSI